MADINTAHVDQLLRAVHTLEPLIRAHADEAERNRHLSPVVVTALAEAGIFRMYTPRTLGGFEIDPLTFYRVVEACARSSRVQARTAVGVSWVTDVCADNACALNRFVLKSLATQ